MGRRQVVESANSALKGAFADLSRGFFRVMGLVKMTLLLGFTLAAYNLDRSRAHKLTDEVLDFAEARLAEDQTLRPRDLVGGINEVFGVVVHPRSVERALARRRVPKSGQR